jgi:hypothetical protein
MLVTPLYVTPEVRDRRPAALGEEDRFRHGGHGAGFLVTPPVKVERRAQCAEDFWPVGQRCQHVPDVHEAQRATGSGLPHAEQREVVRRGQRTLHAVCVHVPAEP